MCAVFPFVAGFLLLLCLSGCHSFYVPAVEPVNFGVGQRLDIKAVKLTSTKHLLPYDYYSLPFCKPLEKIQYIPENLGEIIRGDRIVNTPYKLNIRHRFDCRAVCPSSTEETAMLLQPNQSQLLIDRIQEDYRVHLLADSLPCATRVESNEPNTVSYSFGYRLGFVKDDKVYLNNHLHFIMSINQLRTGGYRIVGFEVVPKSISMHLYTFKDEFCTLPLVHEGQSLNEGKNKVVWSYSVEWKLSDVQWSNRWDNYLKMTNSGIHWFNIVNSFGLVLFFLCFVGLVIIRIVRRDIANYNKLDESDEVLEETGWKLIHGDVFRPPYWPKLFVSFVGTGIQVFGMSLVIIVFAMFGMLSPSSRGLMMTASLFLYCFMGLFSGYFSGRLFKTYRGIHWKKAAFQTALLFPGFLFVVGVFLNGFVWHESSSGALPFTTFIALLAMLLGIDLPLVLIGFRFGYRKQAYHYPVRTNQIPRQVPEQPLYLNPALIALLAGILPFAAMFLELFFIFTAVWQNQSYYLFGFLFLTFCVLAALSAMVTILVTYLQFCKEDYRWWWRSLICGGSSAFYVFLYSVYYFYAKLDIIGFIPKLLYMSYSFLIATAIFFLTGTVGFYASYYFVRKIYGAVKFD